MPKPIVTFNEESLKSDLRELVRRTVEDMVDGSTLDQGARRRVAGRHWTSGSATPPCVSPEHV